MAVQIVLRNGTAAQWISSNPILGQAEVGLETDTYRFKVGNGSSTWTQLPYWDKEVNLNPFLLMGV